MIWIPVIVAWIAISVGISGFLFADLTATFPEDPVESFRYMDRRANASFALGFSLASFALGFSLIPIVWFLSPFLTGFYQHGWRAPWRFR